MAEDATLDAFATDDGGEGEDEAGASEREDGSDATEPESEHVEESDEPATPALTYTSSPDGDECADCGETVQHRWRVGEGAEDPDALVCPDCKVW